MNNIRLVHWHLKMTSQIPGWQSQSVQFCSDAQSCPTLCDPVNCSMPGLPVHHQLPEFTQTHVHWVGDAIQPSHHLSSPSHPPFKLSEHQGLFKRVRSLHLVAKILEFQLLFFFNFLILFFNFTILYWFFHISTWILHGCRHVPHPEPLSHLPPHTIPLGHQSFQWTLRTDLL